jgi:sugar phosphate isomerase/epimerase
MKVGICVQSSDVDIVARAGYDFIELAAAAELIPDRTAGDWNRQRKLLIDLPLPVEAFNSFVRSLRIVGPDVDKQALAHYTHVVIERAAEVGAKIVVFGSGGARNIPPGWTHADALLQVEDFLMQCDEAASRCGLTIVVEPLCKFECNLINTVAEGADLVRRLSLASVRNLADTYHMEQEQELQASILESADVLAHVHTADTERYAPGTGTYDHKELFQVLARSGYEDRISIECDWRGRLAEDAEMSLKHLRAAMSSF